MVPQVPLPHDLSRGLAGFLDLDDRIGKQVLADRVRPASGGDRFLGRLLVPDDHEDVAVGQPRDIVVWQLLVIEELEVPYQFAVPGELLDSSATPRPAA